MSFAPAPSIDMLTVEHEQVEEEEVIPGVAQEELEELEELNERFAVADRSERARLRNSYRDVLTALGDDASSLVQGDASQLIGHVQAVNRLFEDVRSADDAAVDSRVLMVLAELSLKRTQNMKLSTSVFSVSEFIDRTQMLLSADHPDDRDWFALSDIVTSVSQRAPGLECMLGPLNVEHKQRTRKTIVRHTRNTEELRKPTELKDTDLSAPSNETTENVILIGHHLQKSGRIPFFKFIINPHSFPQSVENLFYLSFHIRDGRARLDHVDNELWVEPVVVDEDDERDTIAKKQLVISLDMQMWRDAIQLYKITDTVIPTRAVTATTLGSNKWYS